MKWVQIDVVVVDQELTNILRTGVVIVDAEFNLRLESCCAVNLSDKSIKKALNTKDASILCCEGTLLPGYRFVRVLPDLLLSIVAASICCTVATVNGLASCVLQCRLLLATCPLDALALTDRSITLTPAVVALGSLCIAQHFALSPVGIPCSKIVLQSCDPGFAATVDGCVDGACALGWPDVSRIEG